MNEFCELNIEQKQTYLTALQAFGSAKLVNEKNNDCQDVSNFVNDLAQMEILNNDTVENYLNILVDIIEKFKLIEKINKKCVFFEEKQEILLNKTYLQIEKKLLSCFETIKKTISDMTLSFDEFYEILEKVLTETSIGSVPSCVNQVYVGDLKSFYLNKKYLFVLGMNEGLLPIALSDTGIISDKEINSETIKAVLEPTTKIINKRNKFKLFENILSPTEKCFMSYHAYGVDNKASQPNEFISEFLYLFANKQNNAQVLKSLYDDSSLEKFCFNLVDEYNANILLNDNLNIKVYHTIKNALQKNDAVFNMCKNQCIQEFDICKLFFKNNKTSISVIEKYNSCPKSAYLANALRLQPIKKEKVEANIIGSFLHEVGEKFVKANINCLGNMSCEQIQKNVNSIFDFCLNKDEYYALTLQSNNFLKNLLKQESLRFCTFLNNEQITSDFKPVYVEKYFGEKSDFAPIELQVDGKKYTISGIIDRIDATEKEFRIIDYKTGNTTNASGDKHLYYGTKIQLFVYAYGIKNNMNKSFFGAFYLPIKNGFTKDGQEQYVFSGFFKNDSYMAIKCDKNLLETGMSKIINTSILKVKQDGVLNLKKKANILSHEELNAYLDYSIAQAKQTIMDIQSGYIDCSPINGKCNFCEFNAICKHAFDERLQRTEGYNVTSEEIKNLMEGIKNV